MDKTSFLRECEKRGIVFTTAFENGFNPAVADDVISAVDAPHIDFDKLAKEIDQDDRTEQPD